MKKIYNLIIAAFFLTGALPSCSLNEYNPSTVNLETAYSSKGGFESLINYCYDGLYYFYGKIDGIGAMEMGTDLWMSIGNNESGFTVYNNNMNTELGTLKTIWQGFYSTVNYCNTAIHYSETVQGYSNEEERNAKVAEAYFLRGWSNWHLVEQFGGVVLQKELSALTGPNNSPVRSTEEEFYDQIIADMQYACEHLPVKPTGERGRVTKKAAYAMLAKVCLQRTRLGEKEKYAKMALDAAQELINNPATYGIALYTSDANQSGFSKLWDGNNNKNNTEFLFLEAVDAMDGKNPDSWNRGRTRQYYVMDCRTVGAPWGTQENDAWLSRANTRTFKPTKYLLTSLFEPVPDPADTRFAETFFYEYYNATWLDKEITQSMVNQYGKNPNLVGHIIKNTAATGPTLVQGGTRNANYMGLVNMTDGDADGWLDGLSILTPNWTMSAEDKKDLPFWIVDPSDQFDGNGKWVTAETNSMGTYYKDIYPSFKKFSSVEWVYDRQYWMGDVPIIRLGEVYLIAAEAALLYNNDQATALDYVNTIRKRAAVTGRENDMLATQGDMTLDFILAERGRELAGEQTRWYDLKRMGKLTTQYLTTTNPDIQFFDPNKHTIRPIPQSFLDAIANAQEFGTNGY